MNKREWRELVRHIYNSEIAPLLGSLRDHGRFIELQSTSSETTRKPHSRAPRLSANQIIARRSTPRCTHS